MYTNHFIKAISEINKYKKYFDDTTRLMCCIDESVVTDAQINLVAAEALILKMTKIKKCFYRYDEDEMVGVKISFEGISVWVNISPEEDVVNDKEIERLNNLINKSKAKLDNPAFVEKAPAKILEAEKEKLKSFEQQLKDLLK